MTGENDTRSEALKQAQRIFRSGDFDAAVKAFEAVLQEHPCEIRAHNGIAAAYFQLGQFDKAKEHYTRVTQLELRSGSPWINLGAVLNAMEDFQNAVNALRKGLAKEKRSSLAFYNLGLAHAGLKQHAMAISGFKEALNIDPNSVDAHIALANSYEKLNNHQLALLHFQKAIEINPESRRARLGLQQAQDASEDAKRAISPFGRLVDVNNLGPKSHIAVNRELSIDERIDDRNCVRALAAELEAVAGACLTQITSALDPSVLGINRALAEGAGSPATVLAAFDRFRDAARECFELRKQLRRKVLELRAHEEVVNTPDFGDLVIEPASPPPDPGDQKSAV